MLDTTLSVMTLLSKRPSIVIKTTGKESVIRGKGGFPASEYWCAEIRGW